jgi:uncharacterized protein (DUF885 family)
MMKAIARIEPQVREFFPLQPKAPYGVRRLDPALEQSMTYGYYQLPYGAEPSGNLHVQLPTNRKSDRS